jgi:hypothetical protein
MAWRGVERRRRKNQTAIFTLPHGGLQLWFSLTPVFIIAAVSSPKTQPPQAQRFRDGDGGLMLDRAPGDTFCDAMQIGQRGRSTGTAARACRVSDSRLCRVGELPGAARARVRRRS